MLNLFLSYTRRNCWISN